MVRDKGGGEEESVALVMSKRPSHFHPEHCSEALSTL